MKACLRHVSCIAVGLVVFAVAPLSAQVEIIDQHTVALPWTQSHGMTLPDGTRLRIEVTLPPPNVTRPAAGFPVLYYSGHVSSALMTDTLRRMGDAHVHAILVGVAPEDAGVADQPVAPTVVVQFVRPEFQRRHPGQTGRALYAAMGTGLDRLVPRDVPGAAAFDQWIFAHLDCPPALANLPESLTIVRAECPRVASSKAARPGSSRLMLLEDHDAVTMVPESAVRAIALSLESAPAKGRR